MKKLFFGLLLATIAAGGSAFKNINKSITENYMVQTQAGTFIRLAAASGTCTSNTGLNCKYAVTAFGRVYIPPKSTYNSNDILDYLDDEWLEPIDNVGMGIYHAAP